MKQISQCIISLLLLFIFSSPFTSEAQPDFGNCPTCAPPTMPSVGSTSTITTSGAGIEYKYHSGANIAGARYDAFQNGNSFNVGVAFNFGGKTNAAHESGIGILLGYRYALQSSSSGNLFAGLRTAVWFNKINSVNSAVILQPGLEAGYQFFFSSNYAAPAISYDYGFLLSGDEKSMMENGKIFLGLSAGHKF